MTEASGGASARRAQRRAGRLQPSPEKALLAGIGLAGGNAPSRAAVPPTRRTSQLMTVPYQPKPGGRHHENQPGNRAYSTPELVVR